MPTFQTVRGMRDLLGEEAQTFTYIIAKPEKPRHFTVTKKS